MPLGVTPINNASANRLAPTAFRTTRGRGSATAFMANASLAGAFGVTLALGALVACQRVKDFGSSKVSDPTDVCPQKFIQTIPWHTLVERNWK